MASSKSRPPSGSMSHSVPAKTLVLNWHDAFKAWISASPELARRVQGLDFGHLAQEALLGEPPRLPARLGVVGNPDIVPSKCLRRGRHLSQGVAPVGLRG